MSDLIERLRDRSHFLRTVYKDRLSLCADTIDEAASELSRLRSLDGRGDVGEGRVEAVRVIREWMYERSFKRVRYATASALLDNILAALAAPALPVIGEGEKP